MAKWGVDADAVAAMTRDLEPYSVAYGNKPARSRAAEKRGVTASTLTLGTKLVAEAGFDTATFNNDWFARVPLRKALAKAASDGEAVCPKWWEDWEACTTDPVATATADGATIDVAVVVEHPGYVDEAKGAAALRSFVSRAGRAVVDGTLATDLRDHAKSIKEYLGEIGADIWRRSALREQATVDELERRALLDVSYRRELASYSSYSFSFDSYSYSYDSYSYDLEFVVDIPGATQFVVVSVGARMSAMGEYRAASFIAYWTSLIQAYLGYTYKNTGGASTGFTPFTDDEDEMGATAQTFFDNGLSSVQMSTYLDGSPRYLKRREMDDAWMYSASQNSCPAYLGGCDRRLRTVRMNNVAERAAEKSRAHGRLLASTYVDDEGVERSWDELILWRRDVYSKIGAAGWSCRGSTQVRLARTSTRFASSRVATSPGDAPMREP